MNHPEFPIIEPAVWDTACFRFQIGAVFFPLQFAVTYGWIRWLEKKACEQHYKLLYLWLPESEAIPEPVIQQLSGRLLHTDRKTIYTKLLPLSVSPSDSAGIIQSFRADRPTSDLYTLAFASGQYSRFKWDNRFPPGTFEKLYQNWIERSVSREIADDVLVYSDKNTIQGMLTYRISGSKGSIGLIAVADSCKHQGIGSQLMREFEYRMVQKKITEVEVVTQGSNRPACQFYEKQNFHVHRSINIYHLWL